MYTSFEEWRYLAKSKEREMQQRWEIARWEQYYQTQLSPFIKPVDKPKRPQDLMLFGWEKREEKKVISSAVTKEEEQELNRIFADFNNRIKS